MGKQITFLMDKGIENEFVDQILKNGEIIFEGNNPKPESIKILPEPFSGKGWFKLYIYNSKIGNLVLNELPNGRQFIDSVQSPVIEFIRTVVRDDAKEVSRGRLWVEMKFKDNNGYKKEKAEELNDWYTNLCKWIKKYMPKSEIAFKGNAYTEHASPTMIEVIKKGYKVL